VPISTIVSSISMAEPVSITISMTVSISTISVTISGVSVVGSGICGRLGSRIRLPLLTSPQVSAVPISTIVSSISMAKPVSITISAMTISAVSISGVSISAVAIVCGGISIRFSGSDRLSYSNWCRFSGSLAMSMISSMVSSMMTSIVTSISSMISSIVSRPGFGTSYTNKNKEYYKLHHGSRV